jgi:Flp pilus assembly protein TadG
MTSPPAIFLSAAGRHPGHERDRGSLTLFAVVLAFGLLAMAGLVIDGGAKLTAQRRANHLAEQAARAGAQALDPASLRAGRAALDPGPARAAATAYLAAAGQHLGAAHLTTSSDTVTVTLTDRQPTAVLGLLGIHHLEVTGRGQARLLVGVQEANP